jgi:hypothetical protein
VESDLERGLRILDEAYEQSKSIRIDLDGDYRRAIALAEALPQNQSGADKTWVWRMDAAFREHYKNVRPA